MNKNLIISRNILIFNQLEDIHRAFAASNIYFIVLKGAALISLIPEYSFERVMEDIDILIKPEDVKSAKNILLNIGYKPAPEDPWAFINPKNTAYIDIIDNLWYLTKRENISLWNKSLPLDGSHHFAMRLPYDEFYIHTLAHAALHHAVKESKWLNDINLIKIKWGDVIDWQKVDIKLKKYGLYKPVQIFLGKENVKSILYNYILKTNNPLKGHVSRFVFMPFILKIKYLASTLFPSDEFLVKRYNIKNNSLVFLYRLLRPLILFFKLINFPCK